MYLKNFQWFHWNQIWLLTYIISDEWNLVNNYFCNKIIYWFVALSDSAWQEIQIGKCSVGGGSYISVLSVVGIQICNKYVLFPEFPRFKTALIWIQWLWSQLYRCLFAWIYWCHYPNNVHNYSNRFTSRFVTGSSYQIWYWFWVLSLMNFDHLHQVSLQQFLYLFY
jgi:hypothetical protein